MTLRVTLEIVPFGEESGKYEIYRLDIHNTGILEEQGFGNTVCSYKAELYKKSPETIMRMLDYPEYTLDDEVEGVQHNRRNGALTLVQKVIERLHDEKV